MFKVVVQDSIGVDLFKVEFDDVYSGHIAPRLGYRLKLDKDGQVIGQEHTITSDNLKLVIDQMAF